MPNMTKELAKTLAADAAQAEADLAALHQQVEEAKARHAEAVQAAEDAYAEAHAEEIATAKAEAEANHARHEAECKAHCDDIGRRCKAAGDAPVDHEAIEVMTVDGATHAVIAAHGLKNGHQGFRGGDFRSASRYTAACGLSVDAPHDELHHGRFDQALPVNCGACETALAGMESGTIPDRRSDYLTADEQLAHARATNADRNKASSVVPSS